MYQTLDDLANIQDTQTESSKSRGWIKWFLIGLGLVILGFAVLFIHNGNNKENNSSLSLSEDDIDSDLDGNVGLKNGNIFSRLLQLEPEENDDNDIQSKNTEILSQIKDEAFWGKKIEEKLDELEGNSTAERNFKILGYGLLCKGYVENLESCEYSVGYSKERYDYLGNKHNSFYGTKEIAMNDIGNGGVFYDVYDWRTDNEDEIIQKYLGKDFESTYEGDFRDIEVSRLLTNNDDGTTNYYLYIIDGNKGEILYKNSEKIIKKDNAKKIIAENIGISVNDVRYLDLEKNDLTYDAYFSYNGHTYDYKIDAKDGRIIKNVDEKDVGDENAMEIALKDSGLKATDLWKDISHGHGEEKMLLMPEINKEGTGENAIYGIEIETEDGMIYSYQIKATDGKILLKHLSEEFIIYDKEGTRKNMTYKIKSTHKKPRNLEIKPSELNMDDIYEFKDQIYLWISFDGDKIVDWSIIDRPYKHMGKMTKHELDEYYNFESHYPVKIVDEKIDGEKENVYEIYLSKIDENVIYKYTIMTGRNCSYEIINDTEKDVIVYEGTYGSEKYSATPYLKEGYDGRGGGGCTTLDGDVRFSIMYKEASSDDLFKVIDEKEITYLSKFKVGDELNLKQRYNENYLYNDTNNDLTISVTDYGIVNAPEDFQFTVKPGKFAHCYEYTDIVKIIK